MPHLLILHKEKDDLESELNAVWSFRGVAEKSSGSVFMRRFAPRFLTLFEMTGIMGCINLYILGSLIQSVAISFPVGNLFFLFYFNSFLSTWELRKPY